LSYLNSPRKGCPRSMKICVWTHLGLIKWKATSKKNKKMEDDLKKNGRGPQKKFKMKDNLKKNVMEDELNKNLKMEKDLNKNGR
jgi:hypothetical protein